MKTDYDVIVVGAGGSGLAAALSAAEHEGSVVVLEKEPQPGGTTGIAVGSFTAAGTSLQSAKGIVDDPQTHAEDAARFAPPEIESRNNDALRAWFLTEAAATLEWLEQLGLSFVGPHPEPPNRQPRMHNVVPGAKAYILAMQLALQKRGVEVLCEAPAISLLQTDGRVTGVRVLVDGEPRELHARRGVIVAGGDYSSNRELIARHKGAEFHNIEGINPFADGAGHRLAESAGAELLNMDVTYGPELRFIPSRFRPFEQWLPTGVLGAKAAGAVARRLPNWLLRRLVKRLLVTWQHPENALFDDGALLLNKEGRRFCDERQSPQREIAAARQPDKTAWILLDGRLVQRYSAWPHFISTAPDIAYAYVQDYQSLRRDVTATGIGRSDAAARAGLDAEAVKETIEQFNAYVRGEATDAFGRSGDEHPMTAGPWIILGPVK
ncbi:MAG: FAD-dependent oxidoreductase, partial [Planctomycetes bacterium]|nr:FAD-dependent oxidoreductase [Planctomycetota bacterium]